jgi:hypothetical protein
MRPACSLTGKRQPHRQGILRITLGAVRITSESETLSDLFDYVASRAVILNAL